MSLQRRSVGARRIRDKFDANPSYPVACTALRAQIVPFRHAHNGYRESFAAFLELLDNQRFARAVTPDRAQLEAVMVRRMKSELKLRWDGSRRFAERIVRHLRGALHRR